jgi:S1-C subfamily serine protease
MGSPRSVAKWIALSALLAPGPGWAAEWVTVSQTARDSVIQIDASGIKREAGIAHFWQREYFSNPFRENKSQTPYSIELREIFIDCDSGLEADKAWATQDYNGNPVGSGSYNGEWYGVQPGTVGEIVFKTVCSATANQPKPFLEDIMSGSWTALGNSSGRTVGEISIKSGDIVRLTPDHVVVNSRTDLPQVSSVDGVPYKHIVGATVIDCAKAQWALYGVDYYLTRSFRVKSTRADARSLTFKAIVPGDQLSTTYRDFCKDAKVMPGVTVGMQKPPSTDSFSLGTAWATNKGYLVTANHVVAGGSAIEVYSDGEPIGKAEVVATDPANDLAILKLAAKSRRHLEILPLSPRPAALGRNVFTLGYPAPDVLGQTVKMTAGEISGTTGSFDDAREMQITVPVQPGNSGGPLIAWDGTVLGVVLSKLTTLEPDGQPAKGEEARPPPENINFAIKSAYIRPMLEELPDLGDYTPVKPGISHDQTIAAARKAVFMLVVKEDR